MPAEDFSPEYFDPLSTGDLTNFICERFERQPLRTFETPVPSFAGSGLYAIYYRGESVELYVPLKDLEVPVYAGQGASHNSRTGSASSSAKPVCDRLRIHRRSIGGTDLPLAEFAYRVLLMPDVHANLGEDGLRTNYQPVWNNVVSGFGSNEQGATTRSSGRSQWDAVHPGRNRTYGDDNRDPETLRTKIAKHIVKQVADYPTMPWPHPNP